MLFAAAVFLAPMPFFMLFIIGWVPLACTIAWFIVPAVVAPFSAGIILALHVAAGTDAVAASAARTPRTVLPSRGAIPTSVRVRDMR